MIIVISKQVHGPVMRVLRLQGVQAICQHAFRGLAPKGSTLRSANNMNGYRSGETRGCALALSSACGTNSEGQRPELDNAFMNSVQSNTDAYLFT